MGVPKFFRWLAERYPLVLQKVSAEPVEIDHLYLDMNGIIHNCTHANNAAKATASEDEMMHLVFQYIERLVRIAKPKKLLYMAIDGVAPRAKMNQQRSRRFKAGKERQEAEERARRQGEELPAAGLFDSNCITPGTEFMHRLDKHLKFFVRRKLATDPSWANMKVLYSGYDVPGEGEHKIMEFIRYEKVRVAQAAPNTRHCMYGLDADLILLSLATHEPHFCLLRETVAFNNNQKGQPSREVLEMKKDDFQLLHIGILREYLKEETYLLNAASTYDFERIVDDFVLLCVLVGNDFLPHSPTLDIGEGAMDVIFETYRNTIVRNGHHLTQGECISHIQLETLVKALAEKEVDTLIQRAQDQIEFENRSSRRRGAPEPDLMPEEDMGEEADGAPTAEELFSAGPTMMGAKARNMLLSGDKNAGLASYKSRMYRKMDADDEEKVRTVVEWYMEGLHWVMQYYYRGVPSWSWFYPFHYAPFLSDMKDLQSIKCEFTQSEPVKPFQQLMMVMPTTSKALLPQPFHTLMDDPKSPIADCYPIDFAVDGEGKRTDWEVVILLPFIDFNRLVNAYNTRAVMLSPEAHSRNSIGKMYLFKHQKGSTETSFCQSTLPTMVPSITASNSTVDEIPPKKPLPPGIPGFQPRLTKGCLVGPKALKIGWPSLHIVQFSTSMRSVGVNLLGIVSKRATRILMPAFESEVSPQTTSLLNKVCFFRYPHLMRCKVVELTDSEVSWKAVEGQQAESFRMDKAHQESHASGMSEAKSKLLLEQGIDAGSCKRFFKVLRNVGLLRMRDGSVTVKFEDQGDYVPVPLLLETSAGLPAAVDEKELVSEVFAEGSSLVFRGLAHYGALATVLQRSTDAEPVKYRIQVKARNINFKACSARMRSAMTRAENSEKWFPSFVVARRLGIESSALGRLTGGCRVTVGDKLYDVGLSLRHGTDLCVPELAYPSPGGKGWQYSGAAAQIMAEFQQKFPWVANLCTQSNSATLLVSDAFPGLDAESQMAKAKAVQSWRSQSVLGRMKLVPCSSIVASTAAVREIDATFAAVCCAPVKQLELMDVGRELLVPPLVPGTTSEVTASYADVGDCVAFVGADDGTTPPFGTLGVAIGVHDCFIDVLCAEKFSAGSDLEGRVRKGYGARLSFDVLLNLSDMSGAEMSAPTAKPMATAGTPRQQAAAASAPAAPMIPDGTRGFHQNNGYGRGRPVGAVTPQVFMPPASAPNGQAAATVQPADALPDFMLNLLRTAPQAPAGLPAAAAPSHVPPTATASMPPGITVSRNAPSGGPGADDMVMRLLQGPTATQHKALTAPAVPPNLPPPAASAPTAAAMNVAPAASSTPAVGSTAGAVQQAASSHVQVVQIPSAATLAKMGLAERRATIKNSVVQLLQVAKAVFRGAGDHSLSSSAESLAKGVQASGLSSISLEAVRDCVRHAASQLQSPGEAMGYCWQAESILQHAIQCQSADEQIQAGTAVSEMLVQLQSMDQRVTSSLQLAEQWCYLAASARMGPPWEESEAIMELCLNVQKARSGASSITSTLLDQLSQCVDKLTVGSDLYVSSQREHVKQAVGEAVQLQGTVVQQIPELTGQVASLLLASCNASFSGGQMATAEQQRAQQLLAVACAQQSLTKQTILACSKWISQIQSKDSTNNAMLTNLLSAAELLSCTADRYGLPVPAAPPAAQHTAGTICAVPVSSNVASAVPMHAPAFMNTRQPVTSTPYATGNPMYSQPRMPMAAPPGMVVSQPAHPTQTAAHPTPPLHQGAAVQLLQTPQPTVPVQQAQRAPAHRNALVASLLQGGGGAQQGTSGNLGQVATGRPPVSSTPTATGSIVGIPVAQPQPNRAVSGSDPLLAMWNDLQQ